MSSPLDELQVKVAFLEDAVTRISDEFYLQQKQLRDLQQQHAALLDKLHEVEAADDPAPGVGQETPPHY